MTDHARVAEKLRQFPRRRMIAATATGPIYTTVGSVYVLPLSVTLELLVELAQRAIDPLAKVRSSLAGRLEGERAHEVFQVTAGLALSSLALKPLRSRRAALAYVGERIGARGSAEGLDVVFGSMLSSAWYDLTPAELEYSAELFRESTRKGQYSPQHWTAIIDVPHHSVHLFEPGELGDYDINKAVKARQRELE